MFVESVVLLVADITSIHWTMSVLLRPVGVQYRAQQVETVCKARCGEQDPGHTVLSKRAATTLWMDAVERWYSASACTINAFEVT